MIEMRSDCVGCETCVGCVNNGEYPVLVCDSCKKESEELYRTDDGDLCADCILGQYESFTAEAV